MTGRNKVLVHGTTALVKFQSTAGPMTGRNLPPCSVRSCLSRFQSTAGPMTGRNVVANVALIRTSRFQSTAGPMTGRNNPHLCDLPERPVSIHGRPDDRPQQPLADPQRGVL